MLPYPIHALNTIYWFAPGAQSYLHVPGVTGGGELCFNGAFVGNPLKCLESELIPQGTKLLELRGGQVGSEKQKTKNKNKKDNFCQLTTS